MGRIKVSSGTSKPANYWQQQSKKIIGQYIKDYQLDVPELPQIAQTAPATPQAPTKSSSTHSLAEAFESWKSTWAISKGTGGTREAHWKMLGRVLKQETTLETITITRLKQAQAALKGDGLNATSVNDVMFKTLRRCLEHAVEVGWLSENPAAKLQPLKRKATIRQQHDWADAWKVVEEACNESPESGELLKFMLAFGVGQAEVRNLLGEHVDWKREKIYFRRQKTGKPFDVPILDHAVPIMKALREAGRIQAHRPIFKWRDPWQALVGACKRLGLPFYSPRSLRRTFIIWALEHGIEVRTVAKWQGHRDGKLILSTYGSYVSPEHEQAQIAKLKGAA